MSRELTDAGEPEGQLREIQRHDTGGEKEVLGHSWLHPIELSRGEEEKSAKGRDRGHGFESRRDKLGTCFQGACRTERECEKRAPSVRYLEKKIVIGLIGASSVTSERLLNQNRPMDSDETFYLIVRARFWRGLSCLQGSSEPGDKLVIRMKPTESIHRMRLLSWPGSS